jgi:hypothetical protein
MDSGDGIFTPSAGDDALRALAQLRLRELQLRVSAGIRDSTGGGLGRGCWR